MRWSACRSVLGDRHVVDVLALGGHGDQQRFQAFERFLGQGAEVAADGVDLVPFANGVLVPRHDPARRVDHVAHGQPHAASENVEAQPETFGGREEARTCERDVVTRVAVVSAMNAELMREASVRGAQVYITGQMRQPAREAIVDTGLGVIIVGHRRSEEWALRALAHVLRERFALLTVVLPPRRSAAEVPVTP